MGTPLAIGPPVIYSAEPQLRHPRLFLRRMAADLVTAAEQARWLFLFDLRAQYRQSLLGYAWIVLPSIAVMLTWIVLSGAGLLRIGATDVPYPVYVLFGTTLWQLFVDALNCPLGQMGRYQHLLTKVRLPAEALVISGLAGVLFNGGIRLALAALVGAAFGVRVTAAILLAPLAVLALVVLGLSLGTLLVPVGTLYRDVQRGLGMVLSLWFFATPVVYPMPADGHAAWLIALNPVSPLLLTARESMTGVPPTHGAAFAGVSAAAVVLLAIASVVARLSQPHLVSRLPSR